MSTITLPPPVAPAAAAPGGAVVPRRAPGTVLLGAYQGSGFRDERYLIRRADGQMVLVSELLYRVVEAIDGERDTPRRGRRRHHRHPAAAEHRQPDLPRRGQAPAARPRHRRRRYDAGCHARRPAARSRRALRARARALGAAAGRRLLPLVPAVRAARSTGGPGRARPLAVLRTRGRFLADRDCRPPDADPGLSRAVRCVDALPRVRPRRRLPLWRRPARCHRRRDLRLLARLLHERHRRLPSRQAGSAPYRPRRHLLQRRVHSRPRCLLRQDGVGAARPRDRGHPHGDRAAAAAVRPDRRLLHPQRPRRHSRPVRPRPPCPPQRDPPPAGVGGRGRPAAPRARHRGRVGRRRRPRPRRLQRAAAAPPPVDGRDSRGTKSPPRSTSAAPPSPTATRWRSPSASSRSPS